MIALLLLWQAADLQVAAASDLSAVRPALVAAFEKESGKKVQFTLGSSGMLAKQIEHGAPYDVFLSANERYVADLAKAGRVIPSSVRMYATGVVGLWSRSGKFRKLGDLVHAKHVALANPAHAPYGVAAKEILEKHELWVPLQKQIVYGENVRQALQYAESGNADAVLTAWPLLLEKAGAVLIPVNTHQPIRQGCGVVATARDKELAERFLLFLTKGTGAELLRKAGFGSGGIR
jgi:molybdate transport system substrate-binding protein